MEQVRLETLRQIIAAKDKEIAALKAEVKTLNETVEMGDIYEFSEWVRSYRGQEAFDELMRLRLGRGPEKEG